MHPMHKSQEQFFMHINQQANWCIFTTIVFPWCFYLIFGCSLVWIGGLQKWRATNAGKHAFCAIDFFISMLSWANRVSKNSFRRLVYIVGAHFIYCWITILYIVGAHLYLMLEHISIHSHVHIYIWICRRRWSLTLFFYAQLSYVHHTQSVKLIPRHHASPCVLNFLCFLWPCVYVIWIQIVASGGRLAASIPSLEFEWLAATILAGDWRYENMASIPSAGRWRRPSDTPLCGGGRGAPLRGDLHPQWWSTAPLGAWALTSTAWRWCKLKI